LLKLKFNIGIETCFCTHVGAYLIFWMCGLTQNLNGFKILLKKAFKKKKKKERGKDLSQHPAQLPLGPLPLTSPPQPESPPGPFSLARPNWRPKAWPARRSLLSLWPRGPTCQCALFFFFTSWLSRFPPTNPPLSRFVRDLPSLTPYKVSSFTPRVVFPTWALFPSPSRSSYAFGSRQHLSPPPRAPRLLYALSARVQCLGELATFSSISTRPWLRSWCSESAR